MLFVEIMPNPVSRINRLRQIFRGRFAWGDDVYLRILHEFLGRRAEIMAHVWRKYEKELP